MTQDGNEQTIECSNYARKWDKLANNYQYRSAVDLNKGVTNESNTRLDLATMTTAKKTT